MQGQKEEVGDTPYKKVFFFFFETFKMLSFKRFFLKNKFIITPFIPSLFGFIKGRHEKKYHKRKTTKNYLYCFFNSIIKSFLKK